MRDLIDRFFADLGITPRVTMEADDTEVIERMVEAGFGYSILPQYALMQGRAVSKAARCLRANHAPAGPRQGRHSVPARAH